MDRQIDRHKQTRHAYTTSSNEHRFHAPHISRIYISDKNFELRQGVSVSRLGETRLDGGMGKGGYGCTVQCSKGEIFLMIEW